MDSIAKQIAEAKTAADCARLHVELQTLLAEVNEKKRNFEEEERTTGLKFAGKNAFLCDCGSSVDPAGSYLQTCEGCEEEFCVECLTKCDGCGKTLCNSGEDEREKQCAVMCEGCETALICSDCSRTCNYCKKKVCEDCLQDTTAPFEDLVCPDCFQYIKYINT